MGEIETAWELRIATSVPTRVQYMDIDLENKNTSEFRTVFCSHLSVLNSQVPLQIKFETKKETKIGDLV